MTSNPVPRGRTRILQLDVEVEECVAAPNERSCASMLCIRLRTGAKQLWATRTIRQKGVILMVFIVVSIALIVIGFIFFVWVRGESLEFKSHFEELSGYDLPCYGRSTQLCSLQKKNSENNCLESCQMNWNCITAAYNRRDASCKLYFGNTPFTMGLDPYHVDDGSIYIKKNALYHRLHREADNLFYFVSEEPLAQDHAQGFCHTSYEYSHVALLPYSRQEEGLQVARTVASHIAAESGREVDLLLHIVAGGQEMTGDTHASIARRVSNHLQFQGDKPRNAKLLPVIISPLGEVRPADFFTRYYILCQHDPFNYYSLAAFYFNLNHTIRTGQRRRRHALFIYEDF